MLLKLIKEREGSIYKYAKKVSQKTGRDLMSCRNGIYNLKYIERPRQATIKLHAELLGVSPKVVEDSFRIQNAQKIIKEKNVHITPDGEVIFGEPHKE